MSFFRTRSAVSLAQDAAIPDVKYEDIFIPVRHEEM